MQCLTKTKQIMIPDLEKFKKPEELKDYAKIFMDNAKNRCELYAAIMADHNEIMERTTSERQKLMIQIGTYYLINNE